MDETILKTEVGNVIIYNNEDEIDICYRTEGGDIIDLFMLTIGDNCLNGYSFGDVRKEDYTYKFTITKDEIKEVLD